MKCSGCMVNEAEPGYDYCSSCFREIYMLQEEQALCENRGLEIMEAEEEMKLYDKQD